MTGLDVCADPTGPELSAVDITAWYGANVAVEQASLEMPPGQVTALIGPSGCGKSTFLRVLNRMHEFVPTAGCRGSVLLDGQDLYGADVRPTDCRAAVGMVFQSPNPFGTMTVAQNVLAGPRIARRPVGDKDRLVYDCLDRAGLWEEIKDRLNDPARELSIGQQQRLCLARALALQPRVLLLDEPCSALDPVSTRAIEDTIRAICGQVTTVIATHNLAQATRISDRCAFFMTVDGGPGRIVESGPTARLFASPEHALTESYVAGLYG